MIVFTIIQILLGMFIIFSTLVNEGNWGSYAFIALLAVSVLRVLIKYKK